VFSYNERFLKQEVLIYALNETNFKPTIEKDVQVEEYKVTIKMAK
jgi:hypothetical protein